MPAGADADAAGGAGAGAGVDLPENAERLVLGMLCEADLLVCSELSRGPFSQAARTDTFWRDRFDRRSSRSSGAGGADAADGGCGESSFFARAVRARHIEAFRKLVASYEGLMASRCEHLLPAARNGGKEIVLLSLCSPAQASLHNVEGAELGAANVAAKFGLDGGGGFVLPEPAEPLVKEGSGGAPTSPPLVATDKRGSKVSISSPGSSSASTCAGQPSPPLQARACEGGSPPQSPSTGGLCELKALAAGPTRGGAAFALAGAPAGGALAGGCAVRLLCMDKWGDVYRGKLVEAHDLGWPEAAQLSRPTSSPQASAAPTVVCCCIFGLGDYVAAGTTDGRALVWHVASASGAAAAAKVPAAAPTAQQREVRGPCFRCGQTGHWARSCPEVPTEGSAESTPQLAAEDPPADQPTDSAALAVATTALADLGGEVVAVSGLLTQAKDAGGNSGSVPFVLGASRSRVAGAVGGGGGDWTKTLVLDIAGADFAAVGPVESLWAADAPSPRKPCAVWAACRQGIVAFAGDGVDASAAAGAERLTSLPWSAHALGTQLTAALLVSQPRGLLCGTASGRVLHARRARAGGGMAGGIRCRDVGSACTAKSGAVTVLAADPRLPCALSGCSDGSVKIWDIANGQCLRTLRYFGHGSVTALCFVACAPFRGVAAVMESEPRLRLSWFGRRPEPASRPGARKSEDQKAKRQYAENPGKASTLVDWRGVRNNTRKADIGYGGSEYNHRGMRRKERRDLEARVKPEPTRDLEVSYQNGILSYQVPTQGTHHRPGPAPAPGGGWQGGSRWWEYDESYGWEDGQSYDDGYDYGDDEERVAWQRARR